MNPNGPYSARQAHAPEAGAWTLPGLLRLHEECAGDRRITVAVLDGPVDLTHPCFVGAELEVVTAFTPAPAAGSHHGTHVASILFGQPAGPLRGIAPHCRGLLIPVYTQRADGSLIPCHQMDLARAINEAVARGAQVINISGGELVDRVEADHFLAEAVRRAAESNVLIVAAAGNDGCECMHVPAALPTVLAVGAHDRAGRPLGFSNWGGSLRSQGILAPGEAISGALPGGGTAPWSGTSFAAPVVSGAVALLLALQLAAGRRPDPQAVRQAILESASPCDPDTTADCRRLLAGSFNLAGARARLGLLPPAQRSSHARSTAGAMPAGDSGRAADTTFTSKQKESDMSQESLVPAGIQAQAAEAAVAPPAVEPSGVSPSCACQSALEEDAPPAVIASRAMAPFSPAVLSGVAPSQRGSCGSKGGASYAFVLGELGYDFGCEARLDYFVQQLGNMAYAFDPNKMAEHLDENKGGHPEDANALIWTLNIDATPVYAIEPADQFAVISYVMLTRFLVEQEHEGVERISVAGHLTGTQRLYNGTVVPVIAPVTRGMFNWSADKLVESVLGADFKDEAKKEQAEGIRQFLHRIYYDMRNLGTSPQERAMNFAATNAFQLKEVYQDAYREGLQLDAIDVERSPICRPDSDCWDVKLKFFDPAKRLERARKLYRYTVDVSDIVPVTVGTLRTWFIY
jgi:cyanobactin maturation PatA/PatG family protease